MTSTATRGKIWSGAMVAVAIALAATGRFWLPPGDSILTGLWTAAVLVIVLVASVIWWRSSDEAVLEAHKFAWYWGGTCGMAVGGVIMVMLTTAGSAVSIPPVFGHSDTGRVVVGGVGMMFAQIAGYAIAWVGWWLKRR